MLITLRDASGNLVTRGRMPADPRRGGRLAVTDATLWWPRYMSEVVGYQYTIVVEVLGLALALSVTACYCLLLSVTVCYCLLLSVTMCGAGDRGGPRGRG